MSVIVMTKKLFDRFSWIKPGGKPEGNDVINICDKDNTILCCNKFKDMRLIEICDYLGQDVIEQQKFYNEKDKNSIYYITIDK